MCLFYVHDLILSADHPADGLYAAANAQNAGVCPAFECNFDLPCLPRVQENLPKSSQLLHRAQNM